MNPRQATNKECLLVIAYLNARRPNQGIAWIDRHISGLTSTVNQRDFRRPIARLKAVISIRLRRSLVDPQSIAKTGRSNRRGISRWITGRELIRNLRFCRYQIFLVLRRRIRYVATPYFSLLSNAERLCMSWLNRPTMLWTRERK